MNTKTGLDKTSRKVTMESHAVKLTEVSSINHDFESCSQASEFLGLKPYMVAEYAARKVKIIKSKVNGKTYLIKRINPEKIVK